MINVYIILRPIYGFIKPVFFKKSNNKIIIALRKNPQNVQRRKWPCKTFPEIFFLPAKKLLQTHHHSTH